ncbi:hypothetical protein JKP88DRAFT_222796 [Tribonema minus]|uniref:C2H2-type domain-containing protein n=1 Tax=Tribonema minus TaxID=303371 RepID=A0A836CC06_9STRA|nr:hypothetical protein JKP88DRAFT_222796 [Tribonema minus]
MGIGQKKSKGTSKGSKTKNKQYKRALDTKRRPMDIDQVQDILEKVAETGKPLKFAYDDDLPGGGQFYCAPCARHFTDQGTLDTHTKSKLHKRRLKDVAQKKYTQKEADAGAGKSKEVYAPAHPELVAARAMEAETIAPAAAAADEDDL